MSLPTADAIYVHGSGGLLSMAGYDGYRLGDDTLGPVSHIVSCLKDILHIEGIALFRAPLTDDAFCVVPGDMERAERAAEWAAGWVAAGKRVAVVCREGLNRSGLVAALAIRLLAGVSGEEAMAVVQSKRAGALYNWHFQQALRALPAPSDDPEDAAG